MDSRISHRRRGITKTSSYNGNIALTRPAFTTIQTRIMAYELGSISRSKIEKEASKVAPQLHRLVGHATIFDSATRFIREHINDINVELDRMEDVVVEDLSDDDDFVYNADDEAKGVRDEVMKEDRRSQPTFGLTHFASFNSFAQVKAKETCAVVITTTSLDPEDDSTTDSSDDYDEFDQDSWGEPSPGDEPSGWELLGSCNNQIVPSASGRDSRDEDTLLWSQQPRVLSVKQAQSLLFEAFG